MEVMSRSVPANLAYQRSAKSNMLSSRFLPEKLIYPIDLCAEFA
jgi:hypothetical protein